MKKSLLIFTVTAIALSTAVKVCAFDFQKIDNQVLNGQISRQEAQKTINEAVKSGAISQEELQKYYDQKKPQCYPCRPERPEGFKGPSPEQRQAFEKKLKDAGITKEEFEKARAQGPEAVDKLLKSHGIERPKFKHHRPNKEQRQAFEKKLKDAGITKEEFKKARAQGPEAVHKLLKDHGIERPIKDTIPQK